MGEPPPILLLGGEGDPHILPPTPGGDLRHAVEEADERIDRGDEDSVPVSSSILFVSMSSFSSSSGLSTSIKCFSDFILIDPDAVDSLSLDEFPFLSSPLIIIPCPLFSAFGADDGDFLPLPFGKGLPLSFLPFSTLLLPLLSNVIFPFGISLGSVFTTTTEALALIPLQGGLGGELSLITPFELFSGDDSWSERSDELLLLLLM